MMIKATFLSICFFSLFLFTQCGDSCIEGDGNIMSESGDLESFTKIENEGTVEVRLAFANDYSYVLTGDSNILPEIDVRSNSGTLTIMSNTTCFQTTQNLVLEVFTPEIQEIENSGTGDVTGTTIFENLVISNTGTGDISLNGSTIESINIENTGTGDIMLYDLEGRFITITNTGTGDGFVRAVESLNATITGTGDVSYKGNPAIESDVTGLGELIDAN